MAIERDWQVLDIARPENQSLDLPGKVPIVVLLAGIESTNNNSSIEDSLDISRGSAQDQVVETDRADKEQVDPDTPEEEFEASVADLFSCPVEGVLEAQVPRRCCKRPNHSVPLLFGVRIKPVKLQAY